MSARQGLPTGKKGAPGGTAANTPQGTATGREAALKIAGLGYRVFPVRLTPRDDGTCQKLPLVKRYSVRATSDASKVEHWWSKFPDAAVGIATGSGLAVIDLDVKHGGAGVANWTRWAASAGVSWSPSVTTPTGGQHVYWRTDSTFGNGVGIELPGVAEKQRSAVDVRATGGLVVAYTTDLPPVEGLPEMPAAVAELLKTKKPREHYVDESPERPADQGLHPYADTAIVRELARLDECEREGLEGWDNTTYEVACNLIEFANSPWSGYTLERARQDLLDRAPTDPGFGRDMHLQKFNSALGKVGDGGRRNPDQKEVRPGRVVDLEPIARKLLSGELKPPEPSVGGFFYPRRINALFGPSTAGKTWIALYVANDAEVVVVYIDYEDDEIGMTSRLLAVDPSLVGRVVYYKPPIGAPLDVEEIKELVNDRGAEMVVIDSVGEALAAVGAHSNDELDVTKWFAGAPDAIAEAGPAVVLIDHMAKSTSGSPSQVGSFRKGAAITGAQFHLRSVRGFSRTLTGFTKVVCTKDRNGHFATGETVGRFKFDPVGGRLDITFEWGAGPEAIPVTDRLERDILTYINEEYRKNLDRVDEDGKELEPRLTLTKIRSNVKGNNTEIANVVRDLADKGLLRDDPISGGPKQDVRHLYSPGDVEFVPWDGQEDEQ